MKQSEQIGHYFARLIVRSGASIAGSPAEAQKHQKPEMLLKVCSNSKHSNTQRVNFGQILGRNAVYAYDLIEKIG